jgi:hypothetical protein
MSTHAIKTELDRLLRELRPDVKWRKRTTARELSDFALDYLPADSADPRSLRARELATAVRPRLG